MEIMAALVAARLHRTVPLPDVMIASIAVADRLTVLHDDRDFDRIREVYGAPVGERLGL
jgi:predicted nucleic acid-binding protein